ncbi:hypothetical protein [uncultured Bacteroides sp.]|uniref:hypothetical protein n=1 Tax=uncultured Bacteroides sp. TaxID=162156 RepID=UPI002AAA7426|nr:hypothetical protein [uncultured Bacteroides sp.]
MANLTLTNKKTQYTAKEEAANVKIEGLVSVNDSLKVTEFNGSVYSKSEPPVWLGNFSYNENNASLNMQASKEYLSEASQLVIDTVAGIETILLTTTK